MQAIGTVTGLALFNFSDSGVFTISCGILFMLVRLTKANVKYLTKFCLDYRLP